MKIFPKQLSRKYLIFLGIIILTIPTFWKMIRYGIYSMQDFHIFRLYEYNRCFVDLQIPCRWSPDVAFEYGQPLFNFYGQLSYFYGEIFHWIGFSLIDSLKIIFISSLILSAITMFILARHFWKNDLAALTSSVIYVYAPYRAVDVWVRGAMPEAFSFIFFPLIVYFYNLSLETKQKKYIWFFGLTVAGLILTHNLSVFMFLFFFVPWGIYYFIVKKGYRLFYYFLATILLVLGLTSFYLLPVAAESNFITLHKTIEGYFIYYEHFVSLNELLFSRFWGYGASVWGGQDGLSLAIGQLQWVLPIIIMPLLFWKRKSKQLRIWDFLLIFSIGWFLVFLTHNKSTVIWQNFIPLQYLQFPWRFLGLTVFCFSLCSGLAVLFFKNFKLQLGVTITIIVIAVYLNAGFFHEDLWFAISDFEQFSGKHFEQLVPSSVSDYYPAFGIVDPTSIPPKDPFVSTGSAQTKFVFQNTKSAKYNVNVTSFQAVIGFPIAFFPGWRGKIDQKNLELYPSTSLGVITAIVPQGNHQIELNFTNTPIRTIGNIISLVSVFIWLTSFWYIEKYDKRKN